jgi:hypothetical protein
VRWLREVFAHRPHVRIVGLHDDVRVDYDDPGVWDQHMALVALAVAEPVDVVFTSEAYGGELARRLGTGVRAGLHAGEDHRGQAAREAP